MRKGIKIGPLFHMQANETEPIDEAGPGEIVAVAKIEELHTGVTLGDLALPPIKFPTPMVGLAVVPKSRGDEAKLSGALHKIAEEDPTFRLDRDSQTKELVMTGMSELHLQLIQRAAQTPRQGGGGNQGAENPLPGNGAGQGRRNVPPQEADRRPRPVRRSPHPHATVPQRHQPEEFAIKDRFPSMRAFHYDADNNFIWIDSIVGGTIPNNFLPAVEKGFKERLARGVIAGYQVQDVAVEVYFGKHHPVDSSEQAFKTAGSMAFRNVFQQAKPGLLEPIVRMEITVPNSNLGDINSDMSGRRGRVLGMDSAGGDLQTIIAEVPLAEVTTYARTLSSVTGGQGSYTIEFSHYDVVPGNVQKEIIDKAKLEEEEEE